MMMFFLLLKTALTTELIVTNSTRITYDFGHEIQPYIANEIKFVSNLTSTEFDANKFRIGFRYEINDYVRIDPHLFVDNKRKDDWAFSPGPALRVDFTY